MKKKIVALFVVLLCFTCIVTCGCDIKEAGSLKSLTHPYINQYDCVSATLGDDDLLEKYDYIRITLLDEKNLEVSFKSKKGKKHSAKCSYTYDESSGELCGEIGVLGFTFKERVTIKDGKFTISKPFLTKMLILNFEAK